jgi:hypothetical protein
MGRVIPLFVSLPPECFWWLLTGYVRYAMGRRSTAPSIALNTIGEHIHELRPAWRAQLAKEIEDELQRAERAGELLGDACDHAVWKKAVTMLKQWGSW